MKDVWRYSTEEHGVLCVMMVGTYLMLALSVENWDFLEPFQRFVVLDLVEEQDQSGWMMSDAGEMRVESTAVFTEALVSTTVSMVKMLV